MIDRRVGRVPARAEHASHCTAEAGISLVELLLALALTLVVLLLVTPVLSAVDTSQAAIDQQTVATSTIATTLTPLTDEIASAAVLYSSEPPAGDPNWSLQGVSTVAGDALLVLSETGGMLRCDQWAVAGGNVEERSWAPGTTTAVPFSTVAHAVWPPVQPPFTVDSGPPPAVSLVLGLQTGTSPVPMTVTATVLATNPHQVPASDCEQAPST